MVIDWPKDKDLETVGHTFLPRLRDHWEKVERFQQAETVDDHLETSGQSSAAAPMNCWDSMDKTCKLQADQILAWQGKLGTQSHFQPWSTWEMTAA